MSEYTKDEMERITHAMRLRDIEPGIILTSEQYQAIRYFIGKMMDVVKALPVNSISIHFDKLGQAHSIDNDGIIESVNGEKL